MNTTARLIETKIDGERIVAMATSREREVLRLHLVGYSYSEISRILPSRPSADALRQRLQRFRRKVRAAMEAQR